MKKATLLVCVCLAVVTLTQLAGAQEKAIRNAANPNATSSERQQDGLNGPVRRVRIEIAKMVVEDGKLIEGSRVVRGITTYDVNGRRIDTQASPVDTSLPPGKRQYSHDGKGHITEMIARGEDGSILSREIYQYEFDELGNWKKMTTFVAVYQDGKLSFEPTEVIYQAITYYYGQAIEKIVTASASTPSSVSAPNVPNKSLPDSPQTSSTAGEPKTVSNENATVPRVGADGNKIANNSIVTSAPKDSVSAIKTIETPSVPAQPPAVLPPQTPVTHLSADAQRSVAIKLPQADTSSAAQSTGPKVMVDGQATARDSGALRPKPNAVTSSGTTPAAPSVAPGVTSSDADRFYRQGVSSLRSGEYTQAVDALRQAVYLNPEDALAYAKLGVAYSALEQYKETVAALNLAIRIKAEVVDAEAYYRLGGAYTSLGKHSEALKAFKQALYISRVQVLQSDRRKYAGVPPVADLHYGVALAYQNLENYREAIKEFRQTIDLNPKFAEAYYGLALAHIALDDRKSAEDIERILRSLNRTLADKVAAAINIAPTNFPAGITDTGQRRRP